MSSSNETRKPAGRPSLLSAEQQNALENQPAAPAAFEPPPAAELPRRKLLWIAGGASVLVIALTLAFMSFGESEPAAETLAAAHAPVTAPAAATPAASAAASAVAVQPAQAADNSPLAALTAPSPEVAAIIDEAPPPTAAKPKESLKQMLESGAPVAAKPALTKTVRKPVKEKPGKESGDETPQPSAEEENDIQLLAALVAHAKYDKSATARLPLSKALDQCKKQGKQDAARCRIRVCEGRWKKDECRAYSRSKLDKAASGA